MGDTETCARCQGSQWMDGDRCEECFVAGVRPRSPRPDDVVARLESWLALADNALLDLENGRNADALQKLARVAAERTEGGWSPFDYPRRITTLRARMEGLNAAVRYLNARIEIRQGVSRQQTIEIRDILTNQQGRTK